MKSLLFPSLVLLAVALGFSACGSSTTNAATPTPDAGTGDDAGGDDAATGDDAEVDAPPPLDHGKPSTTYPAFKPDMPILQNNGGPVLTNPVIVTITWDTDPLQTQLETFGDTIGGSAYWTAVTKEYGVNAATSGPTKHVRVPVTAASPLPTTFDETTVEDFIGNHAGSASSGWPAATTQTIYVLYVHPGTTLTRQGQEICSRGVGGYHSSLNVNGIEVAYAILPRCNFHSNLLDTATSSASHELGEAVTDPHPRGLSTYTGFDTNHVSWFLFNDYQPENGDACEFYNDSFFKDPALGFLVQRQWSNAGSAGGHAPCAPARAGVYFNVTPTALEDVTADLSPAGRGIVRTKGFRIKVGETKTFPVGLYSDAASGPWSIRVAEVFYSSLGLPRPPTNHLTVSIDKTSGVNGEIAYVTVTVNTAGQALLAPGSVNGTTNYPKLNFVTVLSSLNNTTSYMPILIVN